jgi:hypothetical protein
MSRGKPVIAGFGVAKGAAAIAPNPDTKRVNLE